MESILQNIFWFILALGMLIAIHEYGHFIVARKSGIKVLKFSIGFGKPIWSHTAKDGVQYIIAMLPLGGYVKMLDEREGNVDESEKHLAFNRQSLKTRTAVVAAGPIFNLVFAAIVLWVLAISGESGVRPWIGKVIPASIADKAGIEQNSLFVGVGDRETATWEAVAFSMLAYSVEDQPTMLKLRNEQNVDYTVDVDLSGLLKAEKQQQVLDFLGVAVQSPAVPPVFGEIVAGEATEAAGIKSGDMLISANGIKYDSWFDWVTFIKKHPDTDLALIVERDGVEIPIQLTTRHVEHQGEKIGRIGAAAVIPEGLMEKYRVVTTYGVMEAIPRAIGKTWDLSVLTLRVMGKIITGQASLNNLSGPISIAQAAGKSASVGLDFYLKFIAFISVSLGVLNLLPIPVLDGGHLFWYLIEAIKGSEVSEATQLLGQKIGIVMLLSLMVVAFYMDITRLMQ